MQIAAVSIMGEGCRTDTAVQIASRWETGVSHKAVQQMGEGCVTNKAVLEMGDGCVTNKLCNRWEKGV